MYGAAGEAAARAVFIFFTTLWLLASVAVGMMALLTLFNLHLQALKVLKDSLPEFYKKQKRSVQRFERQRWSAQRRRHNVYKRFCVDTRAPVLYLRSFSFGVVYELPPEVTRKVDERLAEHYEQYEPVIAVAGPDDKGYMSGPVRLYFDDDIWRAGVTYLMSVSQLVIIQAGITHGTLWELGAARRLLDPERLILSVEDASNPNLADDFYYDFRKYAEVILGCELPESLGSCVHLGFGKGRKAFPQDPRILVGEREDWASFKAAEREGRRRTNARGAVWMKDVIERGEKDNRRDAEVSTEKRFSQQNLLLTSPFTEDRPGF